MTNNWRAGGTSKSGHPAWDNPALGNRQKRLAGDCGPIYTAPNSEIYFQETDLKLLPRQDGLQKIEIEYLERIARNSSKAYLCCRTYGHSPTRQEAESEFTIKIGGNVKDIIIAYNKFCFIL